MDKEAIRAAFESDVVRTVMFAIEYHAAAHAVDRVADYKWDEQDTFRPAMFLIGQSIELALKAYLRMIGLSRSKLQFEYGHNIRRLLRLSEKRGLDISPLTEGDRIALVDANVLYSKKYLQYFHPGTHVWPNFNQISRLASVIIYRAADVTPFCHVLLAQDCASFVVDHLKDINRASAKQVFALPEVASLDQIIAQQKARNSDV